MNIVCENCKAKYSIADEKVAGKAFQFTCKKCSHQIVVNSAEEPEGDGATRVFSTGSDAEIWHLVIDGQQQGPFPTHQVKAMLGAGEITAATYVWREGFEGWLPLSDVAELTAPAAGAAAFGGGMESFGGGGAHDDVLGALDALGPGPAAPAANASADAWTGGEEYGDEAATQAANAAFGAQMAQREEEGDEPTRIANVDPQAMVAARKQGASSADLFAENGQPAAAFGGGAMAAGAGHGGGMQARGFGGMGGGSGGGEASVNGGGGAAATPGRLTGARNENSVLFSLSNLKGLSNAAQGGKSSTPSSSGAQAPAANQTTEGSGLLDIRALAGAINKPGQSGKSGVDDLMSVGAGTSPLSSTLAAPVLTPARSDNRKVIVIALSIAASALALSAAGLAYVILSKRPAEPTTAAAATPSGDAANTTATAKATGNTQAQGDAPKRDAGPRGDSAAAADDDGDKSDSKSGAKATSKAAAKSKGQDSGSQAAAPAPAAKKSGGDDIGSLLDRALDGSGKKPAASAAKEPASEGPASDSGGGDLPETPSREQVLAALRGVEGDVRSCKGSSEGGLAMTNIVVSGSTGRVTSASVSGPQAGTPVESCIVSAVKQAQFPKFKRPSFSIRFPFRL